MNTQGPNNVPASNRNPVSVLLFLAVWSGFLAFWAAGLLPSGEWPPPRVAEPPQLTQAEWWRRFGWAAIAPSLFITACVVVASRQLLYRRQGQPHAAVDRQDVEA